MNPTLLQDLAKILGENGATIIKAIISKGGLSGLLATALLIVVGVMVYNDRVTVQADNKAQAQEIKDIHRRTDSLQTNFTVQLQRVTDNANKEIKDCQAEAEKWRSLYESRLNGN